MKQEKSLVELIIELQECNKRLDRIQNDPTYIDEKVKQIFGDKKYSDKIDIASLLQISSKKYHRRIDKCNDI